MTQRQLAEKYYYYYLMICITATAAALTATTTTTLLRRLEASISCQSQMDPGDVLLRAQGAVAQYDKSIQIVEQYKHCQFSSTADGRQLITASVHLCRTELTTLCDDRRARLWLSSRHSGSSVGLSQPASTSVELS